MRYTFEELLDGEGVGVLHAEDIVAIVEDVEWHTIRKARLTQLHCLEDTVGSELRQHLGAHKTARNRLVIRFEAANIVAITGRECRDKRLQ